MKMRAAVVLAAATLAAGCNQNHTGHAHAGHDHHDGDHAGHRPDLHGRHAHAAASTLEVRTASAVRAGEPAPLSLAVRGPDGKPVTGFEAVHGEKVHLIIVREGLDQFAHLHPAVSPSGELTVAHTFPAAGTYRLFADYQPAGGTPAVATGSVAVTGASPAAGPLVPDVPGEVRGDGLAAAVTLTPSAAGHGVRVEFRVRDETGRAVTDLEPYLGELGHLVFVSADAYRYVHVHPAGGDKAAGAVAFDAHFPAPGLYKGWAQFKRGGRVHTLPLVTRADG
jgi:hypothetical protein